MEKCSFPVVLRDGARDELVAPAAADVLHDRLDSCWIVSVRSLWKVALFLRFLLVLRVRRLFIRDRGWVRRRVRRHDFGMVLAFQNLFSWHLLWWRMLLVFQSIWAIILMSRRSILRWLPLGNYSSTTLFLRRFYLFIWLLRFFTTVLLLLLCVLVRVELVGRLWQRNARLKATAEEDRASDVRSTICLLDLRNRYVSWSSHIWHTCCVCGYNFLPAFSFCQILFLSSS